jgi:hypothetical protein
MGNTMKILKLAWERVGNSRTAVCKSPQKTPSSIATGILYSLTAAKMMDVRIISGIFTSDIVFFYPCVCFLFESNVGFEFIGTYKADLSQYSERENAGNLPSLCVRRGFWDRKQDISAINDSPNKKDYVMSELQTDISVAFVKGNDFPSLESLIEDSIKIIKDGITFQDCCTESESPYYGIHLTVSSKDIHIDVLYNPHQSKSDSLDNLAAQWQRYLVESLPEESMIPDEDFQISYKYSIIDRLSIFD